MTTPLCISTQMLPCGSPSKVTAVKARSGVRSRGWPPLTGMVQMCSGVRTAEVVLENTSSFPPGVQARPLVPSGISARRRGPEALHISTKECNSWCPIFVHCDTTAICEPSDDQAILLTSVNEGHHQPPSEPFTPTTYKLVSSAEATVRMGARGSGFRGSARTAKWVPSGEIVAERMPEGSERI